MPASEGGGCIVDNGPNAYDVVRHLFGEVTVEGVEVTRSATGVDLQAVVYGRVGSAEVVIRLDWAFEGEPDLRASWRDGMALHVDMLAGSTGFKSSLEHEYVGVSMTSPGTHCRAGRTSTGSPRPSGWTMFSAGSALSADR